MGTITGVIAMFAGIVGAMILTPENNQGPLFGKEKVSGRLIRFFVRLRTPSDNHDLIAATWEMLRSFTEMER